MGERLRLDLINQLEVFDQTAHRIARLWGDHDRLVGQRQQRTPIACFRVAQNVQSVNRDAYSRRRANQQMLDWRSTRQRIGNRTAQLE